MSEKNISQKRLKTVLTASILRYFEGRTSIDFVLDLGEAILNDFSIDGDLLEAVCMMQYLAYKIKFYPMTREQIIERLRKILEILTKE